VIFSIYYSYLAHRVSGPGPIGPQNPDELQVAYTRLLKTGLANLSEDGRDSESFITPRPGSPDETIEQLERHDPRAIDFRNSIRTWFCKAPWSSIKLLEMQKWLYFSMFNADLPTIEEIPEAHKSALTNVLELLQKRVGCKIEQGSNPDIVPMRIGIDDMGIRLRPLSFYVLAASLNWALRNLYSFWWNVHHASFEGTEYVFLSILYHAVLIIPRYLLKVPANWDPETSPRPIVFLHGLGFGLIHYHPLISHFFTEFSDRPVLFLLQPHSSHDFFHPDYLKPPNRRLMSYRLARLIQSLGWSKLENKKSETLNEDEEVRSILLSDSQRGVTIVSHSKYVLREKYLVEKTSDRF